MPVARPDVLVQIPLGTLPSFGFSEAMLELTDTTFKPLPVARPDVLGSAFCSPLRTLPPVGLTKTIFELLHE